MHLVGFTTEIHNLTLSSALSNLGVNPLYLHIIIYTLSLLDDKTMNGTTKDYMYPILGKAKF